MKRMELFRRTETGGAPEERTECSTRAARARDERGVTLVEIVIALLVSSIVIVGMYQSFTNIQKWWMTVSAKSDMSQNARAGLETFTRDLEMVGYHSTQYGDTSGAKTGLSITWAAPNWIEMDQQRPDPTTIGSATPDFAPAVVYYHTATDAGTGKQNLYRQIRTEPGLPAADELVAEDIAEFTLSYFGTCFDCTLAPTDPNYQACMDKEKDVDYPCALGSAPTYLKYTRGSVPSDQLKNIRRVHALVRTTTPKVYTGAAAKPYTLEIDVRPQNLTSGESVLDTTAPPAPTAVKVIDTGSCSDKLTVQWISPTTAACPDLAGFEIFYGATEKKVIPLSAVRSQGGFPTVSVPLNSADINITKSTDRDLQSTSTVYQIQIKSYDSSGNYSALSSPAVSGWSATGDCRSFSSTCSPASDTTVNPVKPTPPASLTVAAPSGSSGRLLISWPISSSATTGYRLYRSTSAFTPGSHISPSPAAVNPKVVVLLADESTLNSTSTSYEDTGTGLLDNKMIGCTTYYYAVASVNCDETLVNSYVYSSTGTSDYAVGYGQPLDTSIPPSPELLARAGWRRAFLKFENPTSEAVSDFARTEIWWSKGGNAAPHLNGSTCVVTTSPAGQKIPDADNLVNGTFTGRGTKTPIFGSETLRSTSTSVPTLDENGIYQVLAVAYDKCGNCSEPSAQSLKMVALCGDDPAGPPPFDFTDASYTSCEQDSVNLGWVYPRMQLDPSNASFVKDLAGFRVYRYGPEVGASVPTELTTGPTWTDATIQTFTDSGSLLAGGTYKYEVRATDCVYENDRANFPNNKSEPFTLGSSTTTGQIYPGGLEQYVPPISFAATLFGTVSTTTTGAVNGQSTGNPSTTTTSTVNGMTPVSTTVATKITNTNKATVTVASAANFDAASVSLPKQLSIGSYTVTYTAKTSTTFTGCSWVPATAIPTAGIAVGSSVSQYPPKPLPGSGSATIPVVSTTNFASSGTITVGSYPVTYTGTTATSFTGCVWPTTSLAINPPSGTTVSASTSFTIPGTATIPVASTTPFTSTGQIIIGGYLVDYTGKSGTSFTGCTWPSTSGGFTAPTGTQVSQSTATLNYGAPTIDVSSTSSFATSGTLSIGCNLVTYTGKTDNAFTGCTWPTSAGGYSAPVNTLIFQYDATAYARPENFVTTLSDAATPYTYHNNVKFNLQNTSAGTMTIRRMAVEWENPSVVLTHVTIGGTSLTPAQTITTGGIASGDVFTANVQIRDVATGGVGSRSGAIPVVLRFATAEGHLVNRLTDMTGDIITISHYTDNDSLQDSGCTAPEEIVFAVPRGPAVGGFTQDKPGTSGVPSMAVIGEQKTARDTTIQVPGGELVNVLGTVIDNSGDIAPDGCSMGYAYGNPRIVGVTATATDIGVTPVMPTVTFLVGTSAFERQLFPLSGTEYAIKTTNPASQQMPVVNQLVNWYYALAVDATGNWDRSPNPDIGNFAYYQEQPVTCVAPVAPQLKIVATARVGAAPKDTVALSWNRPATYVNGTTVATGDTIAYDVYVSTSGSTPFTTLLASDQTATSFSYLEDLASASYFYAVVAKNGCTPPNPSAYSNIVRECIGLLTNYCTQLHTPATAEYFTPASIYLDPVCGSQGNGTTESVRFVFKKAATSLSTDILATIDVAETAVDTGGFTTDVTFRDTGTASAGEVLSTTTPVYVDLIYNGTATGCTNRSIALSGGPCSSKPIAPDPINATFTSNYSVRVNWTAPVGMLDLAANPYALEYQSEMCTKLGGGGCSKYDAKSAWTTVAGSPFSKTTTSVALGPLAYGKGGFARYRFRINSSDTCTTSGHNPSAWNESNRVTIHK